MRSVVETLECEVENEVRAKVMSSNMKGCPGIGDDVVA